MRLFGRWIAKKIDADLEMVVEDAWERATEPKGAAESAQFGAELRKRLFLLIEKTESDTGESAVGFSEGMLMMVHPKLLEEIRRQPDRGMLEPALYLCFPIAGANRWVHTEWPSIVSRYRDRESSKAVLHEKSFALAGFITNNLDVARTTLATLPGQNLTAVKKLTEEQQLRARLEEAACWYRVMDELASQNLGSDRTPFMKFLQDDLCYMLALHGLSPDLICDVIGQRLQQYRKYQRWLAEEGDSPKGTLFWEAAKHVGARIEIGRSANFLYSFALGFSQRLEKALVPELLTGQQATR